MSQSRSVFAAAVAFASLAIASCAPEIDAPEPGEATASTPETSATAAPVRTATVALAEFEGFADPATGRFEIERVTSIDPYPQLAAIYEGNGIRTIGQGISVTPQPTLPLSEPAPWCTGRIVNDGAIGTNPPDSFELLTLTGSIGFSAAGDVPNPLCVTPGLSSISSLFYGIEGVFCARVRAQNFYSVPWSRVHAQLYQFSGGSGFSPYALGLGTSVNTNDGLGVALPEYAALPEPGGAIAVWDYGELAAGGAAEQVWTFRRASSGTSAFRFRGRVVGNVAENCGTLDVNEDCDPLDRADNACRLYEVDEVCTDDRDCVSYVCNIAPGASTGVCDDECAAGLYGIACQFECPGGINNVCSGNGSCDDGRSSGATGACTCAANHYGADCSIACTAGQTWTEAGGCVDPAPPVVAQCSQPYATLNDATRNRSYPPGAVTCDQAGWGALWGGPQWYRMDGATGTRMPESPPPTYACGTHAPGWLNGTHPGVAEGVVNRTVCFHWSGSTCAWSTTVQVVNCDSFYLYNLPNAPVCSLRYCGE
jgi:hypothetical protein